MHSRPCGAEGHRDDGGPNIALKRGAEWHGMACTQTYTRPLTLGILPHCPRVGRSSRATTGGASDVSLEGLLNGTVRSLVGSLTRLDVVVILFGLLEMADEARAAIFHACAIDHLRHLLVAFWAEHFVDGDDRQARLQAGDVGG